MASSALPSPASRCGPASSCQRARPIADIHCLRLHALDGLSNFVCFILLSDCWQSRQRAAPPTCAWICVGTPCVWCREHCHLPPPLRHPCCTWLTRCAEQPGLAAQARVISACRHKGTFQSLPHACTRNRPQKHKSQNALELAYMVQLMGMQLAA